MSREGRKGEVVISVGTDTGVNLTDWFLTTNAQESPDVGQRGGRSQNTGAIVGFAAGGGGSEAPAAYTTDIFHLATAVSPSVTQESPQHRRDVQILCLPPSSDVLICRCVTLRTICSGGTFT